MEEKNASVNAAAARRHIISATTSPETTDQVTGDTAVQQDKFTSLQMR